MSLWQSLINRRLKRALEILNQPHFLQTLLQLAVVFIHHNVKYVPLSIILHKCGVSCANLDINIHLMKPEKLVLWSLHLIFWISHRINTPCTLCPQARYQTVDYLCKFSNTAGLVAILENTAWKWVCFWRTLRNLGFQ